MTVGNPAIELVCYPLLSKLASCQIGPKNLIFEMGLGFFPPRMPPLLIGNWFLE